MSEKEKKSQIIGQRSRKYSKDSGSGWSYVAATNVDSGRRSEHKEIKMIITREAGVMFDVLMGVNRTL